MTARINNNEFGAPEIVNTIYQRSLGVGLLFGVASLIAAILPSTRGQFFHSYLLGFMLWLGVTLGSMAFLMIQHLTGGKWGMVIRRQLEAAMKTLPLMAVLFIPIIVGMPHLYSGTPNLNDGWLKPYPTDKHLIELSQEYLTRSGSAHFLFLDGYIARAIVYFAIWLVLAFFLSRWSDEQDAPPVRNLSPRFRKIAAPGLILYAFTISFAVIDWVMSLDPHWISTIYGFIFIAGECLSAMCLMVVVERILVRKGSPRPWQADAHLCHAVGILQLLSVAHHLGGQFAERNYFLHSPPQRGLAKNRAGAGFISFCGAVSVSAVARL